MLKLTLTACCARCAATYRGNRCTSDKCDAPDACAVNAKARYDRVSSVGFNFHLNNTLWCGPIHSVQIRHGENSTSAVKLEIRGVRVHKNEAMEFCDWFGSDPAPPYACAHCPLPRQQGFGVRPTPPPSMNATFMTAPHQIPDCHPFLPVSRDGK